jgi:hypothetical protein
MRIKKEKYSRKIYKIPYPARIDKMLYQKVQMLLSMDVNKLKYKNVSDLITSLLLAWVSEEAKAGRVKNVFNLNDDAPNDFDIYAGL